MQDQSPAALMQLMQGVQASGIFLAIVELGVCTKIAEGATTASAVAKAIGCPERSTRILLDAGAALQLITKNGSNYSLPPTSATFLVRGKPTYMGDITQVFNSPMIWNGSFKLADAVKNDGTVMPEHAETPRHGSW